METDRPAEPRWRGLLERLTAATTGRGHVDLPGLLVERARAAMTDGPAGPTIPNLYGISYAEPPEGEEEAVTRRRLEDVLTDTAIHRGWRYDGPIRVTLTAGGRTPEIETGFERGDLPAWSVLSNTDDDTPLPVRPNRAVVGRSRDADLVVTGTGVSRRHALLWREMGRVWVADFESANGTFVNAEPVYDVVEVRRADVVSFGQASYVFGMA